MSEQTLAYQSGFGNSICDGGTPRRIAGRAELPAAGTLWPVRRAAQRYGIHGAALRESPFLAVPHPPVGHAPAVRARGSGASSANLRRSRLHPISCVGTPSRRRRVRPIYWRASVTMAGNGGPGAQSGGAAHLYAANRSMRGRSFYNADGEMLFVPQLGRHRFVTEFGVIDAEPQEIVVYPAWHSLQTGVARRHCARLHLRELWRELPAARSRPDRSNAWPTRAIFLTPVAAYEDIDAHHELVGKFAGHLWSAQMDHSPLDVVAWHGNYAPYKYDLRRFNAIGSISYDHPRSVDLPGTAQHIRHRPGSATIDFGDFPTAHAGDAATRSARPGSTAHRQRIHGPGARRLRRQGRGLLARRCQHCTTA